MEENKIIRPVYDERDESIGLLAKGAAWDVVLGAAQAAAMVCAVQGNPAWRVCLGLVLLGIGAWKLLVLYVRTVASVHKGQNKKKN